MTGAPTVASSVRSQWNDQRAGLWYADQSWTRHEVARAAAARAALLAEVLPPGALPHVGVLLDNVPEFPFWLHATAVRGATLVGVNSTRRGAELARDITHAECAMLVTERRHLPRLDGMDVGIPRERIFVVDDPEYAETLSPYADATLPEQDIPPQTRHLIVFTSGSTSAPKGVICSQGRLARAGVVLSEQFGLDENGVHYMCMPMFHGNALLANWSPAMNAGAAVVLRRRFSASGFLPDVRKYGVTYFTYVGRAISYILATPHDPADAENTLRAGFGTEAGTVDMRRFERRFGVRLTEAYGASEGGMSVSWQPDTPAGAVGPCPPDAAVLDPRTGVECQRAVFDAAGWLANGGEAIGELVNLAPRNGFEGYWHNEEATRDRVRDGGYWSGDLFYRDDAGFLYFAARAGDRLRVDSENLAVAAIEEILARFEPVGTVVVYAVPDPVAGDQVMAAIELREGARFDPEAFAAFLAAQSDLSTKMPPRFVRITERIPTTATNKVAKNGLRREGFRTADPLWWAPQRGAPYRPFTAADLDTVLAEYRANDRLATLER